MIHLTIQFTRGCKRFSPSAMPASIAMNMLTTKYNRNYNGIMGVALLEGLLSVGVVLLGGIARMCEEGDDAFETFAYTAMGATPILICISFAWGAWFLRDSLARFPGDCSDDSPSDRPYCDFSLSYLVATGVLQVLIT